LPPAKPTVVSSTTVSSSSVTVPTAPTFFVPQPAPPTTTRGLFPSALLSAAPFGRGSAVSSPVARAYSPIPPLPVAASALYPAVVTRDCSGNFGSSYPTLPTTLPILIAGI
jgi:hypothetical protein